MSWLPWALVAVLALALLWLVHRLAQSEATLRAERDKNQWTAETKEQFTNAFKVLATSELEARSGQLKTTAKEELSGVIAPLKEELGKLDRQVRELEAKREGYRKAVERQSEELVAGFLSELDALGLRESTVLALLSDHGESWGERFSVKEDVKGVYHMHGATLYDEIVEVPLVLTAPGLDSGVVESQE